MLEGKTGGQIGEQGSSPFEGLINAEIDVLQGECRSTSPGSQIVGQMTEALEGAFADRSPNIVEDRFKLNWLSEWAVNDMKISSPSSLIDFMSRVDSHASSRWPRHKFIDRVYNYAREQQALRMMRGVSRA